MEPEECTPEIIQKCKDGLDFGPDLIHNRCEQICCGVQDYIDVCYYNSFDMLDELVMDWMYLEKEGFFYCLHIVMIVAAFLGFFIMWNPRINR